MAREKSLASVRDAMLYRIVVLGEAAKAALAADPALKTAYPTGDWSLIARVLNMAHARPRGRERTPIR
jgi:hypothetical protein